MAAERYAPQWMRGQGGALSLSGCFGIVMMLATPLFLVWAVRDLKPSKLRQAQAVTASAVITRVDKVPFQDGAFWWSTEHFSYGYLYKFSVDGHTYSGEFNEHKDVVTHSVDEIVPISYLRSNPDDNNYGGTLGPGHVSPAGDLVLAALTFMIGLAFYKDWPD